MFIHQSDEIVNKFVDRDVRIVIDNARDSLVCMESTSIRHTSG